METYFHRIGRTGRFGRAGVSVILLTENDRAQFFNNNLEHFSSHAQELPTDFTVINSILERKKD